MICVTLAAAGLNEALKSTAVLDGPRLDLEVFGNTYRFSALLRNRGPVVGMPRP
ncbi:MAG: hypothetical protein ACP5MH_12290 [Thermoproteus sp.]